jgi:hypothetical protein
MPRATPPTRFDAIIALQKPASVSALWLSAHPASSNGSRCARRD